MGAHNQGLGLCLQLRQRAPLETLVVIPRSPISRNGNQMNARRTQNVIDVTEADLEAKRPMLEIRSLAFDDLIGDT